MREIVKSPIKLEKGFLTVPEEPGIVVELDEDGLKKNLGKFAEREFVTLLYKDGSVTGN